MGEIEPEYKDPILYEGAKDEAGWRVLRPLDCWRTTKVRKPMASGFAESKGGAKSQNQQMEGKEHMSDRGHSCLTLAKPGGGIFIRFPNRV